MPTPTLVVRGLLRLTVRHPGLAEADGSSSRACPGYLEWHDCGDPGWRQIPASAGMTGT
ncbi:protein of unknown function [Micropruina glycogenica]|uniref:Uncharacterized protein n=1 Tax=Micropruina glycogenica TaxID=75385 RepID=A0A2N9JFG9_9ACTN|nr:protein of unknown function [Micropruina glycogenica]